MTTILLVDDEKQIHRFLGPTLEAAGYTVSRAETGADALREAAAHPPSLVLLDLGLPDMDGQTVLRRLRGCGGNARDRTECARPGGPRRSQPWMAAPTIMFEKPFDVGELLARIRVALRAAAAMQSTQTLFVFGPLEVDLDRRQVRVGGTAISLTPREYDLLVLLVRHAGRVITHKQLLIAVWGPAHTLDVQYLRVYVGHLRQKLGAEAASLLITEPGVGYRLIEQET